MRTLLKHDDQEMEVKINAVFLVRTGEHWHRLFFFKLYWCSETELYEQQALTVSDVSLLNMNLGQELTPFLHPFFSFYPVMKG